MRTMLKLTLATFAGVAMGGFAIQVINAQSKPPAYFVAEIDVTDPAVYKTYVERNTSVVNAHGGRFLVRGGKTTAMDGEPPKRVVIIAWENEDKARAWYTSAAYKELFETRQPSSVDSSLKACHPEARSIRSHRFHISSGGMSVAGGS